MDTQSIFAFGPKTNRMATDTEKAETQPFFAKGHGDNKSKGVLFIHGFSATPASLKEYALALNKLGFCVSLPCLRGHAKTPHELAKVSYDNWLEDVEAAYQDLAKETAGHLSVVGFSLGGALAIKLASKHQEIKNLVLLAPAVFPSFKMALAFYLRPVTKCVGFNFIKGVAGDLKDKNAYALAYNRLPLDGINQVYLAMKMANRALKQLSMPITCIHAKKDHVIPYKGSEKLYRLIKSQKKKFVTLDNCYHEIPNDYDKNIVRDEIIKAL